MTTAAAFQDGLRGFTTRLRLPLWLWSVLALAVAAALTLLAKGSGRTFAFVDSDDALRLIHVRELLAGQPWYEPVTKALGGPEGLVSHWSRLLDGPLALLLTGFELILPPDAARDALVTVWPLALLGILLWGIARATEARHGRLAALCALAFGATGLLAFYQFAPGRIDHHNVMIATTVGAVLLLWAGPATVAAWRWPGALCGIALAIGYEALAPVALIAVLACGWGLFDREKTAAAAGFVIGLAAALAFALAVTVPPGRWLDIACDALSLNIVALAVCGAGAYAVVARFGATWSIPIRLGVVAAGGVVGGGLFASLEPACLAGPMGQVPPQLHAVWMDQVEEAKSVVAGLFKGRFSDSIGAVAVLGIGMLAATGALATTAKREDRFLLAATAGLVALAFWQFKYIAYASLALAPGLGLLVSRLPAIESIRAPAVRIGALLLLNQLVLFSIVSALTAAASPQQTAAAAPQEAADAASVQSCTSASAFRPLGSVPAGLVVTHNDIGAHLAAATHHRALAGPYHRIPAAIIANHEILFAKDHVAAGRLLLRYGADYVMTCAPMDRAQLSRPDWKGSLLAALADGKPPRYLSAVPLEAGAAFRLWRIDRSSLALH